MGINEQANLGENDYANDNILTQLKPNTTASNFREFLDIKDNCNKTQAWRAISRKLHTRDGKQVDQLEPVDPKNMKVGQLFSAF